MDAGRRVSEREANMFAILLRMAISLAYALLPDAATIAFPRNLASSFNVYCVSSTASGTRDASVAPLAYPVTARARTMDGAPGGSREKREEPGSNGEGYPGSPESETKFASFRE